MQLKNRLNLKKYFLLSAFATGAFCLLADNQTEVLVIIFVAIATMSNQIALCILANSYLTQGLNPEQKFSKTKFALLLIGKVVVLFGAIILGRHFIGNRIIIPLLNYIVLIGALGLSLRKGT